MGKLIQIVAFLLIPAHTLCAQLPGIPSEKRTPVSVPKFSPAPVIDGNLDEEVWKHAAVFLDFYQTSPGYNIPPSKPTEPAGFYDEDALCFGFKCGDEPGKIRSTMAARDAVSDEDNVRIWLDTFDDHRRAYELAFNRSRSNKTEFSSIEGGYPYEVFKATLETILAAQK